MAAEEWPPEPMDEEIITLLDEQGEEHDFTLLEIVEIDDRPYALLLAIDAPEEGVIVLRLDKDSNGADVLVAIEDDEEFERVREALESLDQED